MNDVVTLLHDEIQREFEELESFNTGSEEYKTTVDGLTKLVDRAIELKKFEVECQDKVEDRINEENFKLEQTKEENRDRLIKNGIAVAGIIVPSLITIWGTLKSFEFEKEGTVTTIMGRGFINKLLPKK